MCVAVDCFQYMFHRVPSSPADQNVVDGEVDECSFADAEEAHDLLFGQEIATWRSVWRWFHFATVRVVAPHAIADPWAASNQEIDPGIGSSCPCGAYAACRASKSGGREVGNLLPSVLLCRDFHAAESPDTRRSVWLRLNKRRTPKPLRDAADLVACGDPIRRKSYTTSLEANATPVRQQTPNGVARKPRVNSW